MFLILGLIVGSILVFEKITIGNTNYSIHTMLYCAALIIIGLSFLQTYILLKVYAYNHYLLPHNGFDWNKKVHEDRIIAAGGAAVLLGIVLSIIAVNTWKSLNMGDLDAEETMRIVIPAVLCLIVGSQATCTGFMISIMKVKTEHRL